jgi:hypothetical protein
MKYKGRELINYLYWYCSDLLTKEERSAFKNTLVSVKIDNAESQSMKKMLRKRWFSSDEKVLDLLKDGEDAFFDKVVERVFRDNPQKEFLNLCPKCSYLTVTPKAKQCRNCYYSWHNESDQ